MTLICDPNEDHEKHAGPVTPDPWDDDAQTDWPNHILEVSDGNGLDSDQGNDQPSQPVQ